MKHPPERPLVIHLDAREPHPHTRELHYPEGATVARCKVCGGRNACEPTVSPWRISKNARLLIPTERVTLREGDYSAPGMALWKPLGDDGPWRGEPLCVIERKALGDAISTIVGSTTDALGEVRNNRDRFEEELVRMRDYAWRAIVIEGSAWDVQEEASRAGRRFNAASVLGSYAVFSARFGVQVWWACDRDNAEWYIGTMLARLWSEHTGGADWRKAEKRGEAGLLRWARAPVPACSFCEGSGDPCACNDGVRGKVASDAA